MVDGMTNPRPQAQIAAFSQWTLLQNFFMQISAPWLLSCSRPSQRSFTSTHFLLQTLIMGCPQGLTNSVYWLDSQHRAASTKALLEQRVRRGFPPRDAISSSHSTKGVSLYKIITSTSWKIVVSWYGYRTSRHIYSRLLVNQWPLPKWCGRRIDQSLESTSVVKKPTISFYHRSHIRSCNLDSGALYPARLTYY